jgi:hypothetical protein
MLMNKVLLKLHSEGYVFGDLRVPNLLFDLPPVTPN